MASVATYPNMDGPGRLTEICTFRKSSLSDPEFDEVLDGMLAKTKRFPIWRHSLVGPMVEEERKLVLLSDWTSAEEKALFETGMLKTGTSEYICSYSVGEQYQSVKRAFGQMVDAADATFTW
ncbi:hypothetical protein LTR93_012337 [Exophiala xenobiotica]|nr:hypothetical protein LTR93_012337 [Exophiala xenobiotica]